MASSTLTRRTLWQRIRPKGIRFSFVGAILALFTGTMFLIAIRWIQFPKIMIGAFVFLFINALFFIRFRDSVKKSLWQRMMASKFFPRKLYVTNEGRFLVIISLGMGFAAVNTGSNLLYLLLAMLLSIITASGILSELSVRDVSWEIDFPSRSVAQTPTLFPIRVTNDKRAFNSFSLEGDIQFADDPDVVVAQPTLLKLPPRQQDNLFPTVTFNQRGRFQTTSIAIVTGYPFSFFRKSRQFQVAREVIVVPRGDRDIESVFFAVATGFEEHANRVGRGSEFFSVRPMQPGDEWRDVHWKQSARHNTFAVKEYEALTARRVYVRLDRQRPDEFSLERGEEAIEVAASLIKRLAMAGFEVGLHTPLTRIPPSGGPHAVRQLFTGLALMELPAEAAAMPLPPASPLAREVLVAVDIDTLQITVDGIPGGNRVLSAGGLT
jgi:uncharacterized protein (DUF58 family)